MPPDEATLIRSILKEELAPIREELTRINCHLTGGNTPERGLIIQVDRLRQESKRRNAWFGWIATSVVGLFAATLWNLLTGK